MSIQSWLCSNLQLDLPLRTYIWTIYADCRSKMRGLSFFLVILSVYNIYIHLTSWSIMHNSRKKLVAPRSMLWSILLLPLTLIYTPKWDEVKLCYITHYTGGVHTWTIPWETKNDLIAPITNINTSYENSKLQNR